MKEKNTQSAAVMRCKAYLRLLSVPIFAKIPIQLRQPLHFGYVYIH